MGITANTFGANAGESLTKSQQGSTGAKVTASYNSPGQPYLPDSVSDTMGNASTLLYSDPGNLDSTANAVAAAARVTYCDDEPVAVAVQV